MQESFFYHTVKKQVQIDYITNTFLFELATYILNSTKHAEMDLKVDTNQTTHITMG
jgi:hypothetical protein